MFYNYIYLDPRKPGKYSYPGLYLSFLYEPYYVGKGKGNRCYSHLTEIKNSYKVNKIKKIKKMGYNPKEYIFKFNYTNNEELSFAREEYLCRVIRIYPKGPLTNQSYGGLGGKGRIISEKEKKLRSKNHWMTGRTYDELFGIEKAKTIREKKANSLKNHNCYKSKIRNKKLSLKAKNKIQCFNIRKNIIERVEKSVFKNNLDLCTKNNRGEPVLIKTQYPDKKPLYFRNFKSIENFFGITENLIRKYSGNTYMRPPKGTSIKYKMYNNIYFEILNKIPKDYFKYAVL